jgi:hypothetical protein
MWLCINILWKPCVHMYLCACLSHVEYQIFM